MGLKIADLLRWRTSVELKYDDGKPILDKPASQGGKPVVIYMRVVGDEDLQNAYKVARVHSAEKRKTLRDETSLEYKDQVAPIREATKEECIAVIKAAREQNLSSLAYANTVRPDHVKLEEIAVDPDAPTLEEQEQWDAANKKQDEEFEQALQEYVKVKLEELDTELNDKSLAELRQTAEIEVSNLTSLALFLQSVMDYKIINACFNDKAFREKSFDTIEEYREAHPIIKEQLLNAYVKLEQGTDEVKN